MKKGYLVLILILVFFSIIFIVSKSGKSISDKETTIEEVSNEEEEEIEENDEETEYEEEEEGTPDKIERKQIYKKEYKFDGKTLEFVFDRVSEYYKLDDETEVEDTIDGYLVYVSLLANINYKGKTLFKDLDVFPSYEAIVENSELKTDAKNFVKELDYFKDTNGKKYLLVTTINNDGKGYIILDLDKKKELFSFEHEDLDNYDYESFKELEKSLGINLSNYFKNNRKTIILNNNLIGFFRIDYNEKELDYVEVRVKKGQLDVKKTKIKSLTDEQIIDNDFNFPVITSLLDEEE